MSMDRKQLHGFVPAVVTPFTADDAIDEEAFQRIVDWQISIGASGICVAGDNGESWALSPDERGRLTALAVDAARGRAPIIVGASAPTLTVSLAYGRAAVDNGADALLLMPPTYVLKGSADEVLRRYGAVASATDLPIVAYNSPRRAGHTMPLDLIGRLLDAAPIIGIKESDRDFARLGDLIVRYGQQLQVMVGPAYFILPGIALGAAGFIASGPELLGPVAGRIVEIALGKPGAEFRQVHMQLSVIYRALMGSGTWPAALKAALDLIGQPVGDPRDPVLPLDEAARADLAKVLGDLGIATKA